MLLVCLQTAVVDTTPYQIQAVITFIIQSIWAIKLWILTPCKLEVKGMIERQFCCWDTQRYSSMTARVVQCCPHISWAWLTMADTPGKGAQLPFLQTDLINTGSNPWHSPPKVTADLSPPHTEADIYSKNSQVADGTGNVYIKQWRCYSHFAQEMILIPDHLPEPQETRRPSIHWPGDTNEVGLTAFCPSLTLKARPQFTAEKSERPALKNTG